MAKAKDKSKTVPVENVNSSLPPSLNLSHMLRTIQEHHIELSTMADQKANIIIGANSIIFSFAISQIKLSDPVWGLFALCASSIAALIYAILAVTPAYRTEQRKRYSKTTENLLFFGHFTELTYEKYLEEMTSIIKNDQKFFESIINDLYQLGNLLKNRKYKYLTISYRIFLYGVIVSMAIMIVQYLYIHFL